MHIFLATSAAFESWHPDDALLVDALKRRGVEARRLVWGTPTDQPVILRTTWDYFLRLPEFLDWVDACPQIFNPADIVHWNSNKRYLFELQSAGSTIIPTVVFPTLPDWETPANTKLIVKPTVSANAHRTHVFERWDDDAQAACESIVSSGCEALIQPFFDEVLQGELSFIFFDGVLSHCVRKIPAPGDFRVQTEHGGSVERVYPSPELIEQAAAAVGSRDLLYARVDGIERDGTLYVMELEVIEPELYTRLADHGPDRFADAILRRIQG